jgi:hypothetical protein
MLRSLGKSGYHQSVIVFFRDGGDLKPDADRWLDQGELSERLGWEFDAYSSVKFDETPVEGSHSIAEMISVRARSSKVPFWSSTKCLYDNLMLYDAQKSMNARNLFHDLFDKWACIMQFDNRRESDLVRPQRGTNANIIKRVYRCGRWNSDDWSAFKGFTLRLGHLRKAEKSDFQRLRKTSGSACRSQGGSMQCCRRLLKGCVR